MIKLFLKIMVFIEKIFCVCKKVDRYIIVEYYILYRVIVDLFDGLI